MHLRVMPQSLKIISMRVMTCIKSKNKTVKVKGVRTSRNNKEQKQIHKDFRSWNYQAG